MVWNILLTKQKEEETPIKTSRKSSCFYDNDTATG
jgi:hypothetical protein